MENNYLWITWEIQRRNQSLSSSLSATLVEITSSSNRVLRYIRSIYQTIAALKTHRPDILFVQNPSIVLTAFALIYHKVTATPLVVDAHNAGVFPSVGKYNLLNLLTKIILKHTPLTIVTNNALRDYILSLGGNAVALPDPLPLLESHTNTGAITKANYFNVLFICTWADDEPYIEVINAAHNLPNDVCIYITGNNKKILSRLPTLPDNIILTGFISENEFISLLYECDLILDLTTRHDCLVCGAYEAVAAERPMLLSDTTALREYFSEYALYTNNSAIDIAEKISYARKNIDGLNRMMPDAKNMINTRWKHILIDFKRQLTNTFPNLKS